MMGRIAPIYISSSIFIAKCKRIYTSHLKWKNNTFRIRNSHAAYTHHANVWDHKCAWCRGLRRRVQIHWIILHTLYIVSERILLESTMFHIASYSSIVRQYIRPARRVLVPARIFTAYLLTCKSHTEYLLIWDHQPQIISLDEFFFRSPRNSYMISVLCLQYMAYKSHTSATHATNYINRTLNECAFEY